MRSQLPSKNDDFQLLDWMVSSYVVEDGQHQVP